jgi:hypothetical protein
MAGGNVYHAMSSFTEAGNRKQDNVSKTKALFIDVDCGEGKPYADQREGAKALKKFLKDSGMPSPMIVSSGRGLHVYWPLTEALSPVDWQPLANALKTAALGLGFEIDPAVTADSARVLRPIGTHNPKNNAEVVLIKDTDDCDPEDLRDILAQYIKRPAPLRGFAAAPSALTAALSSGQQYEPPEGQKIIDGCAQVAWAVANQTKVEEPFWYALMGIAAFCVDAELTAVSWSDLHPEFDYSKTVLKIEQWKAKTRQMFGGRPVTSGPQDQIVADGQPFGGHQFLGELFVHPSGAGQHAGTHVRQRSHFQQTLNGSVLAVGPVQDRELHVDAGKDLSDTIQW